MGAPVPLSLACVVGDCLHRNKDVKALRKHFARDHALHGTVVADLTYANSLGLTQCRHCCGLYLRGADGYACSHPSCSEKIKQDKRKRQPLQRLLCGLRRHLNALLGAARRAKWRI